MGAQDVTALAGGQKPAALSQDDDGELVAAVRRGDDQAFERIYARYHRRISAYVRGMVKDHARAEDVTQEVFISALRRLRATDQEIALKAWLYEIARNACIDQYRRTQRAPEVVLDVETSDSEPLVSFGPTPDVAMDNKQTLEDLQHAFHGLSEVQHEILVMRELEGRSYREIGERMNLTRPAVESALFRARRRLLEEYEDVASGSRCIRVQRAIASACTGSAGVRERFRIASHVSHCHVCRRHARLSGLGPELTTASLPARVAAVLPLPAFLRRALVARVATRVATASPDHVSGVMGWASSVSAAAEPLSGWITAGAAAATVALAIGSASVIGSGSSSPHRSAGSSGSSAASAASGAHRAASTSAGLAHGQTVVPALPTTSSAGAGARHVGSSASAKPHAGAPVTGRGSHTSGHVSPVPGNVLPVNTPDAAQPPISPPADPHVGRVLGGVLTGVKNAATPPSTPPASPTHAPTDAASNVSSTAGQSVGNVTQSVAGNSTPQIPPPPGKG